MTITKSRDDSCSSFLRAKLIRKEKRSAISSQFMNPSRIFQTVFISNLTNPSRTSLSLLSYKIPSKKEMLSFLAKKDKNKPSTYKPKVPPKYWTFLAKSYHANDRDNNMPLKIKRTVDLQIIVQQFVKTTKTHYRTINLDVESVPER